MLRRRTSVRLPWRIRLGRVQWRVRESPVRRDYDRLERCRHPEVCLRALTPRRKREAKGAEPAVALFAERFADASALQLVEVSAEPIEERVRLKGPPMKRAKLRGLNRNAAVVLGNIGSSDNVPSLAVRRPTRTRWCVSTPRGR